ncbi:MAG: insulinase family protein [Gammaproteobacteria bacterium]|nr:insulinase family protein [Gammaproteobacteria bacterium]
MTTFKRFSSYLTLFALTFLLAGSVSWAQEENEAPEAKYVTTVEGVSEWQLDNGLRILLLPDPSQENFYVNITYLVGSADESYGETGMAHYLEHMVFKGTAKRPGTTIMDELTEHGAGVNGSTWYDRTNYYQSLVAKPGYLEWILDLEADRMINTSISQEEFDSERTIILDEWGRGENVPGRVLSQRVSSVAFNWHNYANSTIGAEADIANVPRERLVNFYRKYYQPDNAVLIIAGKIDVDEALDLVVEKFGSIPRPDRSGEMKIFENYSHEPTQDGERTVTLERVGDMQLIYMAHHIPSIASSDHAAISALAFIMGSGVNSRLYKNLVETKISTSASASADRFKFPGLFWVSAGVPLDGSLQEAESALLASIQEMKESSPTEEELNRYKLSVSNGYKNAASNVIAIASGLSEWSARGDWRLYFITRDRAENVTLDDVQRVAKKYLISSNRTKGYFHPVEDTPPRAHVPLNPDIAELVEGYEGREAVAAGENFSYTPANIASRTEYRTMSNGARVALVPKENRGDTVIIDATMRWGTEDSLMHKSYIASFTSGMMGRGTVNKTRKELADEFTRLRLGGGANVGLETGGFSVNTIRENLEESIKLVAEIAQEPAFDEEEFELLKKSRLTNLEAIQSDPGPLASIALSKHMSRYPKGHPNYESSIEEDIEGFSNVTLNDVKAFYDEFAGLNENTTIAVVGDFDPDEVMGWLEDSFGNWSSSAPYERIYANAQSQEAAVFEINTPDKENATVLASYDFPFTDENPDYEAMLVAFQIFGGGFLNSRVAVRIRQNDGLSYGVWAGFGTHPLDNMGSVFFSASSSPDNAQKVVKAFQEEVIRAVEEGFTDEEVAEAVSGIIDSRKRQGANDGWIAYMLHHGMFYNRELSHFQEVDDNIAAMTTDEVNEAFRKYVSVEKFTFVTAGDFEAAAQRALEATAEEELEPAGE